jgi:hypothetical protein
MNLRIPRWAWWVIAVVVIAGAPIAWYLGSPLFITRVVDEPLPMTDTSASDAMPSGTAPGAIVARGTFTGADDAHKGEGSATIYRVRGDLLLRLDPFRVTNGPDLYVILTKHASPKSRADVQAGYVEVGKLKGNVGSQNYTLPKDANLTEYATVVIYCKPFHVVFATAPLKEGN